MIETAMPVRRNHVPISVVIGIAIILVVGKEAVIGDARWWNLVMAGLLIVVLVVYLITEHQRRDRSLSGHVGTL